MKKFTVIPIILMAALVFTSLASAQTGIPGSGWWSGEQVQNAGDSQATIIITAYDPASTTTYSEQETVDSGASVTFTPFFHFADMPSGFQGSAIVSADQLIKAIVNVTNVKAGDFGVDGGLAAAQYQGTDGTAVADTLYFPIAKGDHWGKTTSFYIQNAGDADATSVVASFTMRNGDTHTYNVPTIGASKMVVFSIHDSTTYAPTENDGKVGGLVVTGDQPLAGVVMEHDTTADPATVVNGTRGFTSADFDSKAYAPVVKRNRYDRFTGIQVQNVNASGDVDVTVVYKGKAGLCAGTTYTDTHAGIPAGESYTFVQYDGTTTSLGDDCAASATIEATGGQIVAVVNEANYAGTTAAGITYSAMPDSSATTKVSIPLFKDNRYNNTTGLQIQNVGTAQATNIVATFNCQTGGPFVAVSTPQTVDVGAAVLFFTPSASASMFETTAPFVNDGVSCGVTVTSDQPIVAIANEMGWGTTMDDNNYEGFNLAP